MPRLRADGCDGRPLVRSRSAIGTVELMSTARHVAVIGGGVLGVSTATQLAERGVAVTLITDGPLSSGASGRSLSWLNSFAPRSAAYHQLRMVGIDRYRTLSAALPEVPWLRFGGGVFWGERAEQIAADHGAVGYEIRRVDQVPGLAVPEDGAYLNPGEGWVDLPSLIGHLIGRFTAAGGRLLSEVGEARPLVVGDHVRGIRLANGSTVDAETVVVAAGAATPALLAGLGVPILDQDSPAALVRTQPVDVAVRVVVNAPRVSLRPTPDGGLVVGAGWLDDELVHDERGVTVPEERIPELLAEASAVLGGHPTLVAEAVAAGPRPMPVDDEPVLGRVDGIAGLYVAFTHSGATLGLIAGELVAEEVVTGAAHPLLDPFRPDRFAL
jgi:glycine/D-amino acid oxidase-like deaminating enzyme